MKPGFAGDRPRDPIDGMKWERYLLDDSTNLRGANHAAAFGYRRAVVRAHRLRYGAEPPARTPGRDDLRRGGDRGGLRLAGTRAPHDPAPALTQVLNGADVALSAIGDTLVLPITFAHDLVRTLNGYYPVPDKPQ